MKKVVKIFEKNLDFDKQQNVEGLKILTFKQMIQRLPIALAQVKTGNTSKHLLNEIRQIYIPCIEKKKLIKSM